jgi:molybdopterin molybdotransferase
MVSVEDAQAMVHAEVESMSAATFSLRDAAGLILAEDLYSVMDFPPFDQSSMDGFAFRLQDWLESGTLNIRGEMQAGSSETISLLAKQAVRIFTGAPLPSGADVVVMQEKANSVDGKLSLIDPAIKRGQHVRLRGSEIRAGELALSQGSWLHPGAVGYLAGLGIDQVRAIARPRIALLITGDEMQAPGKSLDPGQVFESNSFSLQAALEAMHLRAMSVQRVRDDPEQTHWALAEALNSADLVLLTGGISAGDYDFVLQAAEACGVRQLFHGVRQKPGKPLYFGKKDNKCVFGLPGNPASVLTCFYEYVQPALERMQGILPNGLPKGRANLTHSYAKPRGLTHFLKARASGEWVTPLDGQESYRMRPFAAANCLIRIGEEVTQCLSGETVEVHFLPFTAGQPVHQSELSRTPGAAGQKS